MDKKNELLNEEEEKEQERLGKEIDELRRHNQWLKDNKDKLSDPRYILYRLPLTHQQREALHNKLLEENKRLEEQEEKEKKN